MVILAQRTFEEQYEKCVCGCNRLTQVRRDTNIENRNHYIEGVGQLLPECHSKIYGTGKIDDELTTGLLSLEHRNI